MRFSVNDMVKILLATGNPHKARELSAMLSGCDVEVLTLKDVGFAGEIIEDGETFEENAEIKARAAASLGYIGVGDDSGLCVDFLGGAPGVYSARYAGEPCDNSKNNEKLLSEMAGVPEDKRGAKFVCVICCVFPDGRKIVSRGECPGRILTSYAGSGGFGYDPLFYCTERGKSYADMTEEEKNSVSHRARAMKGFLDKFISEIK